MRRRYRADRSRPRRRGGARRSRAGDRATCELAGVEEVARADVRTEAERSEFARLRRQAIAELRGAGLDELADQVDKDLYLTSKDERVPAPIRRKLSRMLDLGEPIAVFIGPPGSIV